MIEPTSADIGRKVLYLGNQHRGGKPEEGVITSFNNWTVFVRYGADTGSKGTDRRDLEWVNRMQTPDANSPNWSHDSAATIHQAIDK